MQNLSSVDGPPTTFSGEERWAMKIRLVSVEPGLIYFRCRGALRHSPKGETTDPLRTLLSKQSWEGNVLLDLRDVEFLSTESVGWLVHWHRWVTKSGGVLGLCSLPPQLSHLFGADLLQQIIPIWENETAARAALTGNPTVSEPSSPVQDEIGQEAEAEVGGAASSPARASAIPADFEGPAKAVPKPLETVLDILIVDDSAVERRRAGSALENRSGGSPGLSGGMHLLSASNGREALRIIQQIRPNLVVTDLMMPELDGLGLVREMRSSYPSIPVILMTANGSEEVAAAALREGAASYVPKKYLARDLGETVETILRLARSDREEVIYPHLQAAAYRFQLPSDLTLISPMVDFLRGHLRHIGLCHPVDELRLAIALRETLVNAVIHGNLQIPSELRHQDANGYRRCLDERQHQSPYKDRHVQITVRETRKEVVYTVRDEGPGFNTGGLPDTADPDNVKRATGRGLYLIRTFTDEVKFNEAGNEITLVKRKRE
jgi:CheY-like chemotaxis protein/anti-anti-sigma regulatory factor